MNMFKSNGGFTLVELIVVIAILAILATVAIPSYANYASTAKEKVNAYNTHVKAAEDEVEKAAAYLNETP